MVVVYICSRYIADTDEQFEKQLSATKQISREIAMSGHEVVVPHLTYTQFLDDDVEKQRDVGISLALSSLTVCDVLCVYVEQLGISEGMKAEIELAKKSNIQIIYFQDISDLKNILESGIVQSRATSDKVPKDSLEKNITDNIDYLEDKMSKILDFVTGGRISKPYADIRHIYNAVEIEMQTQREYAIKNYKADENIDLGQ